MPRQKPKLTLHEELFTNHRNGFDGLTSGDTRMKGEMYRGYYIVATQRDAKARWSSVLYAENGDTLTCYQLTDSYEGQLEYWKILIDYRRMGTAS